MSARHLGPTPGPSSFGSAAIGLYGIRPLLDWRAIHLLTVGVVAVTRNLVDVSPIKAQGEVAPCEFVPLASTVAFLVQCCPPRSEDLRFQASQVKWPFARGETVSYPSLKLH